MNINIAVMAGGQSRRFKADKTLELFDGKPLIQHSVDRLSEIADKIIVVAKDCRKYSFLEVKCLEDDYFVQCPMVGILTALKHFNAPVFTVAADVPFPNPEHVKKLFKALKGHFCAIPDIEGKVHPLYSCYSTDVIPAFEKALAAEEYSLMKALKDLDVVYLNNEHLFCSESEKKSFININTREDYLLAKRYTGVSDD
ncbi:molybdopterin-guanine dinucleotide biosynthesis protein A [Denitrovibrio acetiphilus DSM 12809]|uniref:Probable molybdenum cofactor guanylyltransferase n=1 Tax=Denitrovibrio acetiphilus (strain DSM 12809 / NBRC 114555 / N2460) TaxID=522772 RepID=D4H8T8_DENA2|nr:molybdenum cofactor guanylyltransferase [Denitrovibrio acetiphilus]ADD68437.1 molybdopterin-guanine dinucleotide biosynthesis protein A [Denitrovibrio acetiphilus DSM 12809]